MISTYIQELLATNNRVIVPNYGAFLVRATSKSKDATTLEEKLKDIYFSPFLKFNDELLEKYIIKKEGITKEEAAQKINEFIDEVKKELEQEKPFEIKGFGNFTSDKQGKVQFITVASTEPVTKEKATKAKAPEKKAPAAKKTKAAEPKKEEKVVAKTEKVEEKPKAAEVKPARPAGGKEVVETKKDTKLKEFKPEKEVAPTKAVETKAAPTQAKSIYSNKKEKKPVNKGLVWAIAIGLPLAAIFIWAVLNFNTVKKVFDKGKAKTEKVALKKKPVTTKKQATKTKTEEAKQKTETKTATTAKKPIAKKPAVPQKKYYIIAGSFKNEKYAISYMNKLKAEGYNAERLSERNGMYAVSFNSFADKRKAIAEYKFIAQEKGLQAWILYY
jgi:nucleoid DNA-binding protein